MKKGWALALGVAPFAVAAVVSAACDAHLTRGCEGGQCTSTSVTSGAGGGASCVQIVPQDTNGFPPDVFAVLKKNCFRCHGDPLLNGAPHTFLHYHDTQCIYYPTQACIACKGDRACLMQSSCKTWWSQQRRHALQDPSKIGVNGFDSTGRQIPAMPLNEPPIPQCEQDILRAWFTTCGDDPTATDTCMKGTGTDRGMPCDEDPMGTTSSSASSSSSSSTTSSASSTSSSASTGAGG